MYKCNNCGETFDIPEELIETHGLDGPPYEHWDVCPFCISENIDEYNEDEEDDQ